MINKNIVALLVITLVLSTISAWNFDEGGGGAGVSIINNNTYYVNGSNINLTSTTCAGTDKVSAIDNATGVVTCSADSTGGGLTWSNVVNGTTYLSINPFGFYNSTNPSPETNWNDNFTKYNTTWSSTYNSTYNAYNSSGLIKDWNITGYIQNWSAIISGGAESLWNANYSTFLTHITWANVVNGTVLKSESDPQWSDNFTKYNSTWTSTYNSTYNAYNSSGLIRDWNSSGLLANWSGSYLTISQLLGFGYYNSTNPSPWNATNTSYYLATNPFSFYNSTTLPASGETNWNANYSASGPYPTWANVVNGTVYPYSNPYGYYNSTNPSPWNATNTSYYLATNPYSFYNSTTLPANTEVDPYWTDNFTKYNSTWSAWNATNTSYYLATNPFSFYNSTTLPASGETNWNANYSTFLTHITWANVVNETVALVSDLASYFTKADILSFGYYNSTNPSPETNWNDNFTKYNATWSSWNATNTSYMLRAGDNMTGALNMTYNNITINMSNALCLNQACSRYIMDNGTGVVIKG